MVWVKLDDGFPEHRKAVDAGDDACWLFVAGLCYCARNLSAATPDGFIPAGQVARLTGLRATRKLAGRLVEVGLWDEVDGGFQVHDYGDYQQTYEQVSKRRDATAERVRKHRGNGVTDSDVTALARGRAAGRVPGPGPGVENNNSQGGTDDARDNAPDPPWRRVFDEWMAATERDPARTKLTPDRRRRIDKALDSHGLDDCLAAVRHIGADGWARGANDRGRRFDDIEHALGSAERIERWRDQQQRTIGPAPERSFANAGDLSRFDEIDRRSAA